MKRSLIFMGLILGLFLNAFTWPENLLGAQSSSVLLFKTNTFKSFSTPSGGKYMTFETTAASTANDFTDGSYSSFVVDCVNATLAATVLSAYTTASKFKIDYVKDADFMGRPVMVVKVFTLQE